MPDLNKNFKPGQVVYQHRCDEQMSMLRALVLSVAMICVFFLLPLAISFGIKTFLIWTAGFIVLSLIASASLRRCVVYSLTNSEIYKVDAGTGRELWRVRIDLIQSIKKKQKYYSIAIPKKSYLVYTCTHVEEFIERLSGLLDHIRQGS